VTGFQLKLVASVCMMQDHVGVVFFEETLSQAGYELLSRRLRWAFYLFYPGHLLALYSLKLLA